MKKTFLVFSAFLLMSGSGFSMGKPPEGISLLLVPARPALVQVGLDMAEQGHALLMTYADTTSPDKPFLHLWDGSHWLRVSPEKFRTGDFLRNPASKLVVVGEESELAARLIEQGLNWSPEVLHLGSLNVTELINQMGKLYQFNRREWEWMARRYDLALEDLRADMQPTSWYDSNRASTLPPAERPWHRTNPASSQAPQTSLTPVMPPVSAGNDAVGAESSDERTRLNTPSTNLSAEPSAEGDDTGKGAFRLELEP